MSRVEDLSQIKAEIEAFLQILGYGIRVNGVLLLEQGTSDRLFSFAEAAIKRRMPDFSLSAFLTFCPPERRWARLRANLPDEAIKTLHGHLNRLISESHSEAA